MPKAICPKCSEENDKRMFKNPHFNQQLLEKDKLINELLGKVEELEALRVDPCPTCGCNELLCGWPNECSSENNDA